MYIVGHISILRTSSIRLSLKSSRHFIRSQGPCYAFPILDDDSIGDDIYSCAISRRCVVMGTSEMAMDSPLEVLARTFGYHGLVLLKRATFSFHMSRYCAGPNSN